MTVSTTTRSVTYNGNDSTTVFAYPFRIFADSDLEVTLIGASGSETVLTITTHYTVSGANAASGGNVTMVTAPATGEQLRIRRVVAMTQPTDLRNQGAFYPETHERVFDRLLMQIQQQASVDELEAAVATAVAGLTAGTYDPVLSTGSQTARSLADRFGDQVNIRDFFATGDSVNDWSDALGRALAVSGHIYFPGDRGASQTYRMQQVTTISQPVRIVGDQVAQTIFERDFTPSNAWDGIFAFTDDSSWSQLEGMTLRSRVGQTGGCLFSIRPTSAGQVGGYGFKSLYLSTLGTDTHAYTAYMDGTARTAAPIGIRGVNFIDCYVFGGATAGMLVKGVLKCSVLGGLIDEAGGTSGVSVLVTGTAGVPSQGVLLMPGDMYGDVSTDYASDVVFAPGLFSGDVINTANTSRFHGRGNAGSVQTNWSDNASRFENLGDGQVYANTNIFPRSRNGTPTGTRKTSSTTSIGTVGAAASSFAVPDTQTFTFTLTGSGLSFNIGLSSGEGALVFVDNASATVTLVANPSTKFEASSTPGAGKVGIFKSAGSNVVSVKNGTGGSITVSVVALGAVTATTDPA